MRSYQGRQVAPALHPDAAQASVGDSVSLMTQSIVQDSWPQTSYAPQTSNTGPLSSAITIPGHRGMVKDIWKARANLKLVSVA